MGPNRGDFDRKPDLIFVRPIVEQQLAECLVDATVNPGAFELNQLIGEWNGSWHLMARVCVRAILHPVLQEFEQRHDFKAALTIRFSTGLPKWKHESQIQRAGKILHEVHEAIRMGIESDFLIGIVGFWWSMEPQKARDVGVLLTAIDIFVRAYPDQAVESLNWNAAELSERIRLN